MDISDQIKNLQNLSHDETGYLNWQPYMEKYRCEALCEIGIRRGGNFKNLIKHQPKMAVAIDCWTASGTVAQNESRYSQAQLDQQYQNFKTELSDKSFVKIYRDFSFNAVKEFEDESFDFVMIDGDHTYEGCRQDLTDWYPKVKRGGLLCGDDYARRVARTRAGRVIYGVIEAVDEFVRKNNLSTFFLFNSWDNGSYWGIIKI